MMMQNSKRPNSRGLSPSVVLSVISIIASVFLSACSGGISGTGDGTPPIVIDPNAGSTAGDLDSVGTADGGASTSDSPPAPTTDAESAPQTPDVSLVVPDGLRQLNTRRENISATQPLAAQLVALQQEAGITLGALNSSNATPVENISTAFETTIRYTQNDTTTIVASNSASTASYLFSENTERIVYILQENQDLTLRHLDIGSNSLLQAKVILAEDGSTIIEADQNQNGMQTYFQILADLTTTTVFSQHPTDTSIARQRELIDETGGVSTVQNCTAQSQNCDLTDGWSNSSTDAASQFNSAQTTIANSLTDVPTPSISLPDNVDEAVISHTFNIPQPTPDEIHCGVQRVTDSLRTFCLLPLPIENGSVFSENLAGGEIFYQLLEQ